MEALAAAVKERFGAPHFVFNNAGVGAGGLIWESSRARLGMGAGCQSDGALCTACACSPP
jgi:NAD(P)-dependent dehydrogenase (short-subunit alcohol dehydrogenase family)